MNIIPEGLAGKPCPKCGTPVDSLGDHVVSCIKNNIWRRHMALQDALLDLIQRAGFTAVREVSASTDDQLRPGDIFIPRWDADGPCGIDLTVRHPYTQSNPIRGHESFPEWEQKQEKDKEIKYREKCMRAGWSFYPFVVSTWGSIAPQGTTFMNDFLKIALGGQQGAVRVQRESTIWQTLMLPSMKKVSQQLRVLLAITNDDQ